MEPIATVQTANEKVKDIVYGQYVNGDFTIYCRDCETAYEFSSEEIDYSKSLPHIECPQCKKMIQLPAKYYNAKE